MYPNPPAPITYVPAVNVDAEPSESTAGSSHGVVSRTIERDGPGGGDSLCHISGGLIEVDGFQEAKLVCPFEQPVSAGIKILAQCRGNT